MFGYGWDGGGWGWGAWVFMSVFMVLVWGAIVTAVVLVVRSVRDRHAPYPPYPPAPSPQSPGEGVDQALRLLDERFARGEIDEDEYTRRRDLLRAR